MERFGPSSNMRETLLRSPCVCQVLELDWVMPAASEQRADCQVLLNETSSVRDCQIYSLWLVRSIEGRSSVYFRTNCAYMRVAGLTCWGRGDVLRSRLAAVGGCVPCVLLRNMC